MAFDGETEEGTVAKSHKASGHRDSSHAASGINQVKDIVVMKNVLAMQVRALPLLSPQPPVSLASILADSSQGISNSSNVYSITVQGPIGTQCIPGQAAYYTWRVMQALNNSPVTLLEQYLGAGMHVFVVNSDQSFVSHDHGMPAVNGSFGPDVTAQLTFPMRG